jgi:hypothetical protein
MVRRIKSAKGIDSVRILRQVIRCIPAMLRYIQSTGKRNGIINDDDLLMMRCAYRMTAVETKMDPSVGAPGMAVEGNNFAIGGRSSRNPTRAHKCGVSDYGAPDRARSLRSMEKRDFAD